MTFSHYQAHTSHLFKQLYLLKLQDIIVMSNIIFTHKTLNNKTPVIFNDYFKIKTSLHQHNTINNLNTIYSTPKGFLDIPKTNTTSGQKSIRCICSKDWNTILRELSLKNLDEYNKCELWLQTSKLQTVKRLLKENFIQNY